jgi:hypothetical protein
MKPFASLSKRSVDPDGPGFIGGLSGRPGPVRRFSLPLLTSYLLLLTLLFAPSLYAQWEPDYRLTYDPAYSWTSVNSARCVAAGSSGDVHVVWQDQRDKPSDPYFWEIYYKRSTDGGLNWGPDTRLTFHSGPGIPIGYTPSVAVSGPYVHVVWADYRNEPPWYPEIYYKRSTDWGGTWEPETRLTFNAYHSFNPSVAAYGSGVHLVWQDTRLQSSSYIWYKGSNDNGFTWSTDLCLNPDQTYQYTAENPSVSVLRDTVHVVWDDNHKTSLGEWEIYYRHSTNGGLTWQDTKQLTDLNYSISTHFPSISSSGAFVHVVWMDGRQGNYNDEIYYQQSTDYGEHWLALGSERRLTNDPGTSEYPSISASGHVVHLVWDDNYSGTYNKEIYYQCSTDDGENWQESRLTNNEYSSDRPHVAVAGSEVHVVWKDTRDYNHEIYYKRNPSGNPFIGFKSDSSNGRHLVRDPNTGNFHMVMASQDNKVYYTKSVDGFTSWSEPVYLGNGKYPTIGLAYPPEYDQAVPYVAYQPYPTSNYLKFKYLPPGTGGWQDGTIPTPNNPGPPSLVTVINSETPGARVYVAFRAGAGYVYCQNFNYNTPSSYVRDLMDTHSNCSQPCLAVDGNGMVYGAWRWVTNNEVWYGRRGSSSPYWSSKLRVDQTTDPSQQPFVECYGDSVFVAWADREVSLSNFEAWRVSKDLSWPSWQTRTNVSNSLNFASESPTQAWREFTTWSEWSPGPQPDINYWRPSGMKDVVESNPNEWSYWTHSQMRYPDPGFSTDLWSAWTESPNPNAPPYRVLTKHQIFLFFGPGLGSELSDYGSYYKVLAGQDSASRYCRKRDGVLRFQDKAVDFARDSLVYELPYLDPVYDYFVRVASYRETGSDWVQGLSVNGGPARTVRFAPNLVDTAWVRIPPEAYERDRKVTFSLKNVRGDYVTGLSLTLFQRDPKGRGKGGPQAGEPVAQPVMREVFAVYPNPMKDQVQIEYSLKAPSEARLSVYDVMGRLVRKVVEGRQPAGVHRTTWDGKNENGKLAPGGVYFLRLNTPERTRTARLVLVR